MKTQEYLNAHHERLQKEHLISYEYYYQTLSNSNKIYTGLIEKIIKGKNQDYYERYEYNEELPYKYWLILLLHII